MNLARGLAVILGWLLVALRPNTDLLYKNLRSNSSDDNDKVHHTQTHRNSFYLQETGGGRREKEGND